MKYMYTFMKRGSACNAENVLVRKNHNVQGHSWLTDSCSPVSGSKQELRWNPNKKEGPIQTAK